MTAQPTPVQTLAAGPTGDAFADDAANVPPLPRVSIQAFCELPDTMAAIDAASRDRRMNKVHYQSHMGGIPAAVDLYTDEPTPNVVIVEADRQAGRLMADLERLADVCDAGTKVVVVGHVNDIRLYRELTAKGVSDYLVAPVEPMSLIAALSGVFRVEDAGPVGRVIAFLGAKGGAGASTVAHNCAWAISHDLQTETVIADLDLPFGTAGLDFNQDPPQGIAEAVFSPDRLDDTLLDRLLSKCSERLSILASPATLERPYDIDETGFEGVFDILRATVPCVILDVPHVWNSWTQSVLAAADEVVIVASPDLASLRNTKNLVDAFAVSRASDTPPRLILNGVDMPKRPEIKAADFTAAVGLEPMDTIKFDPALFGTATNNGQMIGEIMPNSPEAEGFSRLAHAILGREVAKKTSKSALAPLLSRLSLRKG